MLDWGDTGVGQPLLDLPAFLEAVPPSSVERIRAHWLDRWRAAVPGCDARRAAQVLAPVAAARQAVIYQTFVDHIEPVERRHHDADVIDWLRRGPPHSRGQGRAPARRSAPSCDARRRAGSRSAACCGTSG